jgi:predicted Fe-S protein YdhL (DUF1289 family)
MGKKRVCKGCGRKKRDKTKYGSGTSHNELLNHLIYEKCVIFAP